MKHGAQWRILISCLLWEGSDQFSLPTSTSQQRILEVSCQFSNSMSDKTKPEETTLSIGSDNDQRILESRRAFLSTSATATTVVLSSSSAANAVEAPRSPRPTVYRVDATIPPVLQPIVSYRHQMQLLNELGSGSGTPKAVPQDLNLNNMLNRTVVGTVRAVQNLLSPKSRAASASFVCLALASMEESDMELCTFLVESLSRRAKQVISDQSVALGLTIVPITSQDILDKFIQDQCTMEDLVKHFTMVDGISNETIQAYQPLLLIARRLSLHLLAMGLPSKDSETVLKGGLQSLEPEKRTRYVVDPSGFIAQTNEPKFKLYTERVLLRSVDPSLNAGNYFAERILAHEAAATVASQYVTSKPKPRLVTIVAPTEDLRYLGGINGRLPRVYNSLVTNVDDRITENDVTTILLNPTAASTLSRIKRIRLEIGTGPDTLEYQTKVADYLWFSSSPAVSLLRRVMDY